MKICLLAIGKTLDIYTESINDYAKRINRYIPFSIRCLPEAKNTKNMTQELQKNAEGVMFANEFEKSDYVVLLDEKGKELSSKEFSAFMAKKMQTVPKRIVFVVGGPYGFSADVYARANEMLSLSRMTFPHDLIRLVFVEQLYRAFTILHNEPYHHE